MSTAFILSYEKLREVIREELGSEAIKSFPKPVIISIDDGTMTQYTVIKTLLEKYRSLVINWAIITDPTYVHDYYGEDSIIEHPDKLRRLVSDYEGRLVIHAHGHQHKAYNQMTYEEILEDMQTCKQILEKTLNTEINSLVYPGGGWNADTIRAMDRVGFTYGSTILQGNPLYMSRRLIVRMTEYKSWYIPAIPSGWYGHNNPASFFEDIIDAALGSTGEVEFLSLQDFAEKMRKWNRLGIEINFRISRLQKTGYDYRIVAGPVRIKYFRLVTNTSSTKIVLCRGLAGFSPTFTPVTDNGFAYVVKDDGSYSSEPTIDDIYTYEHPWLEVTRYDTTNNVYEVMLKEPIDIFTLVVITDTPAGYTTSWELVYSWVI